MKGKIFSGVQPTGNLHLGNYLGAIKQWVKLQNDYDCIFCIVDMHAITVAQNPDELRRNTREMAAAYIAAGINPDNAIIYNQSMVSQHAELAWILGCNTPMGWLSRMTQFKDKAHVKEIREGLQCVLELKEKHNREITSKALETTISILEDIASSENSRAKTMLGLFAYPTLMAADILLYNTTHVPVGEDQKQHIELARDIAISFNHHFKNDAFIIPEPLIQGEAARVMSLQDGAAKMSKSDPAEKSRINLNDDADTIAKKFKKAKADMDYDGIFYDKEKRPEISNLMTIYASLADCSLEAVGKEFAASNNGDFKKALADIAVEKLAPITAEMSRLNDDTAYLDNILRGGAEKAAAQAEESLKKIKDVVGFLRL